jgi:hypothetical protein
MTDHAMDTYNFSFFQETQMAAFSWKAYANIKPYL